MIWVTRARPKVEGDDHRLLARASVVCNALYAWCRRDAEPAGQGNG